MDDSVETKQAKPHYKRRKLLINAKVQILFLIYGVSLALFTLWSASVYHELFREPAEISKVANTSEYLSGYVNIPLALALCVGFSIFILAGIYFSNLIVGPIYRLMSHMDAINEGKEVTELTFRGMDFFQEILPTYNQFTKTLQSRSKEPDQA